MPKKKRKKVVKHFKENRHHYKLASDLCVAVMGGWIAEVLPHYLHDAFVTWGGKGWWT